MCVFERLIYTCGCHKGGAFDNCLPIPPNRCPGVSIRNIHENREYNLHTCGPTEVDSFCRIHAPLCALMEVETAAREASRTAVELRRANSALEERLITASIAREYTAVEGRPTVEEATRAVAEAERVAEEAMRKAVEVSLVLSELMERKGRQMRP